jgi:hypothetical protein
MTLLTYLMCRPGNYGDYLQLFRLERLYALRRREEAIWNTTHLSPVAKTPVSNYARALAKAIEEKGGAPRN